MYYIIIIYVYFNDGSEFYLLSQFKFSLNLIVMLNQILNGAQPWSNEMTIALIWSTTIKISANEHIISIQTQYSPAERKDQPLICWCVSLRPEDHRRRAHPVGEEAGGRHDPHGLLPQCVRAHRPAALHGEPASEVCPQHLTLSQHHLTFIQQQHFLLQ